MINIILLKMAKLKKCFKFVETFIMKILKNAEQSDLFQIKELSEDDLIALLNVCINYRGWLVQMHQLDDKSVMAFSPGGSAKEIRIKLKIQEDFCSTFIDKLRELFSQITKESSKENNYN